MRVKINRSLCSEISESISEYLRGELSESKLERFNNHIRLCKKCKSLVKEEKILEENLFEAVKEENLQHEISDDNMNLNYSAIMEAIKVTPQIKSKIPLKSEQREELIQKTFSIKDIIAPFYSRKAAILMGSPAIFLILFFICFKSLNISRQHISNTGKASVGIMELTLREYNNRRNIQTLFGLAPRSQFKNYLNSFALNILNFEPPLQKTILYKLESMKIFRRRFKKTSSNRKIAENRKDGI